jgi:hypothetical protein
MRAPIFAVSAALLNLPTLVGAQAIPAGYVESARLKAVATNQTLGPKVIDNKGEVGGYNVTPLGFLNPYFYSAPQVNISPVVGAAGVPKVLPRHKSTFSTWLLDKKDHRTWAMGRALNSAAMVMCAMASAAR